MREEKVRRMQEGSQEKVHFLGTSRSPCKGCPHLPVDEALTFRHDAPE